MRRGERPWVKGQGPRGKAQGARWQGDEEEPDGVSERPGPRSRTLAGSPRVLHPGPFALQGSAGMWVGSPLQGLTGRGISVPGRCPGLAWRAPLGSECRSVEMPVQLRQIRAPTARPMSAQGSALGIEQPLAWSPERAIEDRGEGDEDEDEPAARTRGGPLRAFQPFDRSTSITPRRASRCPTPAASAR